MKRSDLADLIIAEHPDLRKDEANRLVRTIFDSITEHLASGGRVELRGFGSFDLKTRDARSGRNPRTGETVAIEEKSVVFFKTGKELRDRLNADRA